MGEHDSAVTTAPEGLLLIQELVNTFDVESGEDDLGGPEALHEWLAARGLGGHAGTLTASDVGAVRAVREGLRAALRANHGNSLDPKAVDALNAIARSYPVVTYFDPDGIPRLRPGATGVSGALGHILSGAVLSVTQGTWTRLKVCAKDGCEWAFYDHSKNGSRRWCSMRVCGNRAKTRAYRRRQRA